MDNLGDLLGDLAMVGDLPLVPALGEALPSVGGWGLTLRGPDDLPGGVYIVDAWSGAKGPIGMGLFSVWREMMSMVLDSVVMTKPAWIEEFGDLGGNSSTCSK